jgi:hypothetical protein
MSEEILTEIDPVDAAFYADYEVAATPKVLPPDGTYFVQMPDEMPDEAFTVKATKDGKRYLAVVLDPIKIVGSAFADTMVRFLRVSTLPIQEYVKSGTAWVPGKVLNASDAADVLQNFGTGDTPTTVEEWKSSFRRLCGQVSPHPFYLTWGGYDKLASGKAKYLRSKDFPKNGDVRSNSIERTNAATGETYKVYANLGLGRRGAAPKA